jgi:hypothetical protein
MEVKGCSSSARRIMVSKPAACKSDLKKLEENRERKIRLTKIHSDRWIANCFEPKRDSQFAMDRHGIKSLPGEVEHN